MRTKEVCRLKAPVMLEINFSPLLFSTISHRDNFSVILCVCLSVCVEFYLYLTVITALLNQTRID